MPRIRANISGKRLRELVEAALSLFSQQGYEQSQMSDVAKAMGVAAGTVYLYVEGKEALFDLAIRHATAEDSEWLDDIEVPVPTPKPGSTLQYLQQIFDRNGHWPLLEQALEVASAQDIRTELNGVIREQYQLMAKHRRGLMLLSRSALEFPGLSDTFVLGLRKRLLECLARYLILRITSGQVRPLSNVAATAAIVTQSIAWANLQRPVDPALSTLSEDAMEDATVDLIVTGLLASQGTHK